MLHKTKGIVLSYIKYGETSIIVRIFTEAFGLQSYIVNSVRSKKARSKMALYQPLTLLELVVYYKEGKSLQRISELKCTYPFQSIPFTVSKSTIGIFLGELLSRIIRDEDKNEPLFEFLETRIEEFDKQTQDTEDFHLIFLIELAFLLGFGPSQLDDIFEQFGEHQGIKKKSEFDSNDLNKLILFIQNPTPKQINSNALRRSTLNLLLNYYSVHVPAIGELKSIKILNEVLN